MTLAASVAIFDKIYSISSFFSLFDATFLPFYILLLQCSFGVAFKVSHKTESM